MFFLHTESIFHKNWLQRHVQEIQGKWCMYHHLWDISLYSCKSAGWKLSDVSLIPDCFHWPGDKHQPSTSTMVGDVDAVHESNIPHKHAGFQWRSCVSLVYPKILMCTRWCPLVTSCLINHLTYIPYLVVALVLIVAFIHGHLLCQNHPGFC